MDKHLIALDLDGTLLNDKKIVTQRTVQTLNAAREAGHVVMIATGRPFRVSKQYYSQLKLDTPIVNMNGALVHHPRNQSWDPIHSPLPRNVAHDIFETCYNVGVQNIMAEIRDEVFLDQNDEHSLTDFFLEGLDKPATIGRLKDTLDRDPSSILIHPFDDRVGQIRDTLDQQHSSIVEHRKWGAPFHVIEIVRSGLHKAIGVQKIAEEYGIPQDRVIAFGDEDNDLEMIEFAGVGVAMNNGIDELKTLANETTLTNHEDGVAHFIEQYLNISAPILTEK
ncbi:Cof-type HAD-IIB family hydrolase [Halalkalibacillus sediminis]|uniref:Cof-type HAD-IIB family hydrolase n=1 Tax=Halalkalibacillus sediminis TaxID=2018042 RepID=A0A2I0QYE4_9BACI|nr:Cof-type HAD-IIB family hydrolase [Halalkalibacillus sediminis]PKR79352.1 Cof-type HAD-IIB family hydrolase [Halalkalibacillus sediminis]